MTEEDLRSAAVGTQEVPRVEGARPPPLRSGARGPGGRPAGRASGSDARREAYGPGARAAAPQRRRPTPALPTPAAPPPARRRRRSPDGRAAPPPPGGAAAPTAADARPATALFSPPEVALRVGQTSGLALVLVGAKDVQSIEVTLTWDPALAEMTDAAAGSLLTLDGSPVHAERAIESGRARVRFARATGATGSGAVVALTMKGLKAGSCPVAVESLVVGRGGHTERPAPPAPGRLVVAP